MGHRLRGLRRSGFTLPELLAELSIATLLVALVLPAWGGWIAEQRVEFASGRLLAELTSARGSAIGAGASVRLCAVAPDGSCARQREWSRGWLSQQREGSAWRTVRDSGPLPGGVRVEAAASNLQEGVTFEPRGFAVQASGGFASGSWLVCAAGARSRTVTLAPSGRARISTGALCS